MSYTIPFPQLNKTNISAAGGKGANLGEMTTAGFPVPAGFVLTTQAYDAFVQANGLQQQIVASRRKRMRKTAGCVQHACSQTGD